jgi:hypothetical protein
MYKESGDREMSLHQLLEATAAADAADDDDMQMS